MNRTRSAFALVISFLVACGNNDGPSGPGTPVIPGTPGNCATGCLRGYQCMSNACALNPSGLWQLTVTSGMIATQNQSGSAWDSFGGAPDPIACLTINGSRSCTTSRADTFTPSWNMSVGPMTATALLAGITAEILDEDVSINDTICAAGVVPVTQQNFLSGTWGASCNSGSFQATLTAQ